MIKYKSYVIFYNYIGKKKKKTTSCKIVYIYKFLDIYFILIYDDEKMILYLSLIHIQMCIRDRASGQRTKSGRKGIL